MTESGRILLFTGDGKGKTTAALGTVLRAAGQGMTCLVVQFIKSDRETGEIAGIGALPGVEIVQTGLGFVPRREDPSFEEHRRAARQGLALAERALQEKRCDLLVLDEICPAAAKGLLEDGDIAAVIAKAGEEVSVILTGRNATVGLIALADTVTEMRAVKHALKNGRRAKKGIEY